MIQKWDRAVGGFLIASELSFTVLRVIKLINAGSNVLQIAVRSVVLVLLIALAILLIDGRIVGRMLLALVYLPLSIYVLASSSKALEAPSGNTIVASSVVGFIIGAYCLVTAIKLRFKNT